jgi:hypothetical protein
VVFLIAEVMPVIQQRCTTAREKALRGVPTPPVPTPATSAPKPPTPVESGAEPTAPVPSRPRLRLPAHLQGALDAKTAETGRPLTAAEVQAVLNVAPDYAARIADQLAA